MNFNNLGNNTSTILATIFSFFYIFLGIYILFFDSVLMAGAKNEIRIIFGSLCLLYAFFRLYRIYMIHKHSS